MSELFPILSGLLVGALLGYFRPRLRLLIGIPLAIALGLLATMLSGEFEISLGFLLIDIPLVAISAVAGLVATSRLLHGQREKERAKRKVD